jgi:chromosome condensin MukBEF complex kleisin-like MukF subunit
MESLVALWHKVRTFGIPIPEPAYIFCDNESVVNATSRVEGRLNKKHLSICFHHVREMFAQSIGMLTKVARTENIADLLTKVLPSQDHTKHAQKILRLGKCDDMRDTPKRLFNRDVWFHMTEPTSTVPPPLVFFHLLEHSM